MSHNISSLKLTRTKLADLKEICSPHAAVEMLADRVDQQCLRVKFVAIMTELRCKFQGWASITDSAALRCVQYVS